MTRLGNVVVLAALVLAGCSREAIPAPSAGDSLSTLAALGMAEGLLRQADELEAQDDLPGAIARVERILELPFPEGTDREDVRLDAHGRLAELLLAQGDAAAARVRTEAGLGEASRDSYFHARLLLVLGRVQQAEAAALRARGEDDAARTVSVAAVTTLEQSIAMNERVLARLRAENEAP